MGSYTISDKAASDLAQLWDRISEESGNDMVADRFVDGLLEDFQLLADFPQMGKARDDLKTGLRSLSHKRYLIFYLEAKEGVEIARVVYGGRDLLALFADDE
jgi:toxin ParE1/3/4